VELKTNVYNSLESLNGEFTSILTVPKKLKPRSLRCRQNVGELSRLASEPFQQLVDLVRRPSRPLLRATAKKSTKAQRRPLFHHISLTVSTPILDFRSIVKENTVLAWHVVHLVAGIESEFGSDVVLSSKQSEERDDSLTRPPPD
jgi:hypothetical protein